MATTIVPPGTSTAEAAPVRVRRGKDSAIAARSRAATGFFNGIGLIFAAVMFFPIYWMINTAFKTPD